MSMSQSIGVRPNHYPLMQFLNIDKGSLKLAHSDQAPEALKEDYRVRSDHFGSKLPGKTKSASKMESVLGSLKEITPQNPIQWQDRQGLKKAQLETLKSEAAQNNLRVLVKRGKVIVYDHAALDELLKKALKHAHENQRKRYGTAEQYLKTALWSFSTPELQWLKRVFRIKDSVKRQNKLDAFLDLTGLTSKQQVKKIQGNIAEMNRVKARDDAFVMAATL